MRYRLRRYDGEYRKIHELIVPLRNGSGTFRGIVRNCANITGQDVTDRSAGVFDSRTSSKGCEGMLQPGRTRLIGSLAGAVAHDFNEVLTIVMGAGAILRNRARNDSELKQIIDQILECSERAAVLAECLLEVSRGGFGCSSYDTHVGASADSADRYLGNEPAGNFRDASFDGLPAGFATDSVLLVENDPHLRQGVRALLECVGYSVLAASTADEALVQFTRCRSVIKLVILGQSMIEEEKEFHHQLQSMVPDVKILFSCGCAGHQPDLRSGDSAAFMGPLESLTFLDRVRKMIAA